LNQSSYGNKHAALFHLFCVHNCTGMPLAFSSELTNLCKTFYWRLTQNHGPEHGVVGGNAGQQATHHGDGKALMSVKLYKSICCWLLDLGTTDGLFALCVFMLTLELVLPVSKHIVIEIEAHHLVNMFRHIPDIFSTFQNRSAWRGI